MYPLEKNDLILKGTIFMSYVDPVLTAKEIAEDLHCSKPHVYRLMRGLVKGVTPLPYIQNGRKKVTLRSILEDWKRKNLSTDESGETIGKGTVSPVSFPAIRKRDTGRRDALHERNNACGNGISKVQ